MAQRILLEPITMDKGKGKYDLPSQGHLSPPGKGTGEQFPKEERGSFYQEEGKVDGQMKITAGPKD